MNHSCPTRGVGLETFAVDIADWWRVKRRYQGMPCSNTTPWLSSRLCYR